VDGRSSIGLTKFLGRARNCLWFALTGDTLHVGAHFPFNLFIGGFDLTIPVATISAVSKKDADRGTRLRAGGVRGDGPYARYCSYQVR
jgi:hypothetical protein